MEMFHVFLVIIALHPDNGDAIFSQFFLQYRIFVIIYETAPQYMIYPP